MTDNNSEIYQLIEMAEKVSEQIANINDRIEKGNFTIVSSLLLSSFPAIGAATLYATDTIIKFMALPLFLIGVASLITALMLAVVAKKRSLELNRSKKIETDILHNLLIMIHEYKEQIYKSEKSPVERAIIDMRLKRIEFSGNP